MTRHTDVQGSEAGWAAPPPTHRTPLRLAAAALLAGLAAAPAAAQTTITLVSNTGQTDGTTGSLASFDQAQAFTTGAHAAGYKLTGVDIQFSGVTSGASFAVSIWTDASGSPGTSVGNLTSPSALAPNALNAYTSSAGIDLTASTSYFVVVDSTFDNSGNLRNTASNNEDAGGQSGWSIANGSPFRNRGSTGSWQAFDESKKIAIKGYAKTGGTNNAPVFNPTAVSRSVAENSAAGTDVGAAVTATDGDNDPLAYSLDGTDAASFTIARTSGQIRTRSGVTYDYETTRSYTVIVKADDNNGGTDTVTVTIDLTDVDEPPRAPAAPRVTATPNTTDSLTVRWSAPSNTGRPAIDDYDLQYREGTTGNWTAGPQNVSGTSATITGLTAAPHRLPGAGARRQ